MGRTTKKRKSQRQGPVELFCPYCDQAMPYGYDPALGYCRCTGCGVSTEDFHTRTKNGLWDPQKKDAVERAVKESGVVYRREKTSEADTAPPEGAAPAPTWTPPQEKAAFSCVECSCGASWEALPGVTTCPRCLRVYRTGADGTVTPEGGDGRLRCPACGSVVTGRPEKGAAYLCLACGAWVGADAEGRKVAAQEARREREQREAFYPTPENLHDEGVRAVVLECYAFSAEGPSGAGDWCWERDGKCLLYLGRRCRWFEDAVWPARFRVWGELKVRREKPAAKAPTTPQAPEEAGEEAPVVVKVKPCTEAWEYDGDTWALYTEDPARAEEARKAGLREMCAYTRRGIIFAWQFLGPKGAVRELAGKKKGEKRPAPAGKSAPGRQEEKARHPAALSLCPRCKGQFQPRSNRQVFCDTCAKAVERERKVKWKRAKTAASKEGVQG
jgi:hypothetical protein